ncbi:hypothetical protein PV08_05209 [Exophiala spinifera]|uniref:DUF1330 domain-containing protein n=1 Tax=Exophiala spinifera TaxID=91928 RepID=A0A0D2BV82_9EURO|nr:uncharacterized protein PV08_05209 [Exophiala spinifera]KIW15164.1 hypothetical protein PV08_05209 [Exophiala spinifera]
MATNNVEHYLGDLEAATKIIPPNEPYIMMNLMRFKSHATYNADYQGPKVATGKEAYLTYKDKFNDRVREMGLESSIVLFGKAYTQIVAGPQEGESWDVVVLLKFSSWAAFKSVLEDEKYIKEIQPHRLAALQELRSFAVIELLSL